MGIRVGFVGAGYIARWHAEALGGSGARLVAVCDPVPGVAQALAQAYGATPYASLEDMLSAGGLDAVHVLSPPNLHHDHAILALKSGVHVLVEKPFALTTAEAQAMVNAADTAKRLVAVNHNFLALPGYLRLKRRMIEGVPGKISSADIRWRYPLAPLRSGPFGAWMLRKEQNLLFELGPHLFAFAVDLFGPLTDLSLRRAKPIGIAGNGNLSQDWRIAARAGDVDVAMHLSLVEGFEDRSLELSGVNARARLDFGADVLLIERPNASDIVVNPFRAQVAMAMQHFGEASRNAWRQATSMNRKSPYALGIRGAVEAFHAAVEQNTAVDARFSGAAALMVVDALERTVSLLTNASTAVSSVVAKRGLTPRVLVIGGTGFIGRALVRKLVEDGQPVRVLSRGKSNPFADLASDVEIVSASLSDPDAVQAAMAGIDYVYHLGKAEESSWEAYLRNDVAVCELVARAALAAGVKRLVYTGTIASYDASNPTRQITEDTEFGPMENRNLYARSKALCEERLLSIHRETGLPVVIARPGIVVGPGGPLQHWGVGRWHGPGAVRVWGSGRHPLPFVLIDDVTNALDRMAKVAGIDGQSFNLVGDPMLSARGYFDEIHKLTGVRIRVSSGNLTLFYLADHLKYLLKRFALHRQGLSKPSRVDWKSRAHLSPFGNGKAKEVLGWQPESDVQLFARRAIMYPGFFGF